LALPDHKVANERLRLHARRARSDEAGGRAGAGRAGEKPNGRGFAWTLAPATSFVLGQPSADRADFLSPWSGKVALKYPRPSPNPKGRAQRSRKQKTRCDPRPAPPKPNKVEHLSAWVWRVQLHRPRWRARGRRGGEVAAQVPASPWRGRRGTRWCAPTRRFEVEREARNFAGPLAGEELR